MSHLKILFIPLDFREGGTELEIIFAQRATQVAKYRI